MRVVINGITYEGEPVYRDYSDDRRQCLFFSREIKKLSDGSWKFVRWVPLHEVKLDQRQNAKRHMSQVSDALVALSKLPGIKVLPGVKLPV